MNYRKYELLAAESIMTASTKTIDLKGLDPISRINIQTLQINDDADLKVGHIAKIVTKIQIVDGSNVLYEATGVQTQSQDFYQGRKSELNLFYHEWTMGSRCNFAINFGRKLYDQELAFDPSKYKNPQLKISHNYALGGSNGTTACTLRVDIDVFDQLIPSLIGFLQFKEIFTKDLTASGTEYIDLPLEHQLKSIMLQCLFPGKHPSHIFSSIKLTEDNGKRIVMEDSMEELAPTLPTYRLMREFQRAVTATGLVNLPCTPSEHTRMIATGNGAPDEYYLTPNDGGYCQVGAQDGGIDAFIQVEGYCPHGAISIPFGDPMIIADWYDVSLLDKLQLKLTAGQYAATGQDQAVLLEQLVKY